MFLNDNNLAESFNAWVAIYEYLSGDYINNLDDVVWQVARQYEEMPILENIYQKQLLYEIEWLIRDKYDNIGVETYINACCSSLSLIDIDGNYYGNFYCLNDFIQAVLNCQELVELVA